MTSEIAPSQVVLTAEPLTPEAFAPFGDVVQADGSPWFPINRGTTKRFHRLSQADVVGEGAQVAISLFHGDAFELPLEIRMLERHPLGSQCFLPMNGTPCLVVVAPPGGERPDETQLRAFYVRGDQGVSYRRGTWHHPLMSLGQPGHFAVVDRTGPGHNCDEVELGRVVRVERVPG